MVKYELPKLGSGVRFSSPAPLSGYPVYTDGTGCAKAQETDSVSYLHGCEYSSLDMDLSEEEYFHKCRMV